MVGEELGQHLRHLFEQGVVGRRRRTGIDHDDHIVRFHLFSQHQYIFPVFHLAVGRSEEFSFAAAERLQGFLGVLIGEEDDLGAYLTTQTTYETEARNEIMLFLCVPRYPTSKREMVLSG